MVNYTSHRQISIEEFKTPFQSGLDKNNRWVRLARQIPWDRFATIYSRALRADFGRPSISPRVVIGALIIKHMLGLSDEGTIEMIREHPYLQYFLGYAEFTHGVPFDASLFVAIRKRLGVDAFNEMSQSFIEQVEEMRRSGRQGITRNKDSGKPPPDKQKADPSGCRRGERGKAEEKNAAESDKRGRLILDATVAPADIKYPTDLDLLNSAREVSEDLIDRLYIPAAGKTKPRTYRQVARRVYLSLAKQRKKSRKKLRQGIRRQLNYLRRNLAIIHRLLDEYPRQHQPLRYRELKSLWVITELYRQQRQMYEQGSHRIENRIVSLGQPHVRPIVRGKAGKEIEFGAKLSASLIDGYAFVDRISWDNYNEGIKLSSQVEGYKERFGVYPEVVIGDQIYGTRENRRYLKELGIRFSGKALGRPVKLTDELARDRKRRKDENRLRNRIEGKFGQGKRKYDLNCIRARTMNTSTSWIAAIFLVMNLVKGVGWGFFVSFLRQMFSRLVLNVAWIASDEDKLNLAAQYSD